MLDMDINHVISILTKSSVLLNFLVGVLIIFGVKYLSNKLDIENLRYVVLTLLY